MMGTNCLAPFLLTALLEPILRRTAVAEAVTEKPFKAVRVLFVSSFVDGVKANGGVILDENGVPTDTLKGMDRYMQTKCGDVFLGTEFAKRLGKDGILSMSLHPGLMRTELQRNMPVIARVTMVRLKENISLPKLTIL